MKDFEHKDYFDARLCFHGDEEKVVAILDSYVQNQIDLTNINKVFELYHTKLFFEIVSEIPGWTEEKYSEYKRKTLKLNNVVHEFFKSITEDNIVAIFDECYVSYWDDFRDFFYKFKTYTCISRKKICDVLKGLLLKELYEKNVISMQYMKSPILKELIAKGEIVTDNKLLTKPEYQYFDYLLNNSEFSDGKAIRNRYIHDSIITDEKTMTNRF